MKPRLRFAPHRRAASRASWFRTFVVVELEQLPERRGPAIVEDHPMVRKPKSKALRGGRHARFDAPRVAAAIARGRDGDELTPDEITALSPRPPRGAAWCRAVLPSRSRPLTSACSSSTRYFTAGKAPEHRRPVRFQPGVAAPTARRRERRPPSPAVAHRVTRGADRRPVVLGADALGTYRNGIAPCFFQPCCKSHVLGKYTMSGS